MVKKRKIKKDPNEEIGSKYNIAAWQHFGRTKKLKGGFGFDGKEVEGTLKAKGHRTKGNKNITFKFKPKGGKSFSYPNQI
jgi:hypothetical protein